MPRGKKTIPQLEQISISNMPAVVPENKTAQAEPTVVQTGEKKEYKPQYFLADMSDKPSRKMPLRPIPLKLSDKESRRQIIYVCPKCGSDFEKLGRFAHKCWKCESPIDWTDLPMMASVAFRDEYENILKDTDGRKKLTEQQKETAAKKRLDEYVARCSD